MEVQLGEPWTRPREGARRSVGGGVGCQGAGNPKWERWQASRVVEELAEQFEGWETRDKESELEKDPLGEAGPPPGITKSQWWLTLAGHCFRGMTSADERGTVPNVLSITNTR